MLTGILLVFALVQASSLDEQKTVQEHQLEGVALLRQEAEALKPLVETSLGRSLLEATANLPTIAPRTLYVDKGKPSYFTEASVKSLDQAARGVLTRFPVDPGEFGHLQIESRIGNLKGHSAKFRAAGIGQIGERFV